MRRDKEGLWWVGVRIRWYYDGEEGVYEDAPGHESCPLDPLTFAPNTFLWDEGNYSCDCNRAMLFFGWDAMPCGETIEILTLHPVGLVWGVEGLSS